MLPHGKVEEAPAEQVDTTVYLKVAMGPLLEALPMWMAAQRLAQVLGEVRYSSVASRRADRNTKTKHKTKLFTDRNTKLFTDRNTKTKHVCTPDGTTAWGNVRNMRVRARHASEKH